MKFISNNFRRKKRSSDASCGIGSSSLSGKKASSRTLRRIECESLFRFLRLTHASQDDMGTGGVG